MKNILYALAFFLFSATAGFSAETPTFDIRKYCEEEHDSRNHNNNSVNMAIGSCIKFEKNIQNKIINTNYPQAIINLCVEKMEKQKNPSYFHLHQCLQINSEMN